VPTLSGIDVAHVLESEVVGDLPGRQEGVEAEAAGQEGRPSNAIVWSCARSETACSIE
jgi:hypothetical protein